MSEVVAFPDIEAALRADLIAELAERDIDVEVSTFLPNPRPDTFVKVTRVGGVSTRFHDRPSVMVEVWAPQETDASDLARVVRALVFSAPARDLPGAAVSRVEEISGLQNWPDPDTRTPRYRFTASLRVNGAAI